MAKNSKCPSHGDMKRLVEKWNKEFREEQKKEKKTLQGATPKSTKPTNQRS